MRPDSPYKGLASFGDSELDSLFFFGRTRERQTIVANVLANKLTVVYGPSGVGKSSLLRAGVAQALRAEETGAVAVHDIWGSGALEALIETLRREVEDLGPTAGLADTVAAVAQQRGEVHLLLDQFEECFRYEDADVVVRELTDLLRRPGLRVTVLIALRDDALAELDVFTSRVPEMFGNLLRVDALTRNAAREAIVRPLDRFTELTGEEWQAEPALVAALLDQTAEGDRVEMPFLQLVLDRLWHAERDAASATLRLATLERLGGAERIVHEHVHGTLDALTADDEEATARIIRQLITPSGAKLAHTERDLAALVEVDQQVLRHLVAKLERNRILRAVDTGDGSSRVDSTTTSSQSHCLPGGNSSSWRANGAAPDGSGNDCWHSSPPLLSRWPSSAHSRSTRSPRRAAHTPTNSTRALSPQFPQARSKASGSPCMLHGSRPIHRRRTCCARVCRRCAKSASCVSAIPLSQQPSCPWGAVCSPSRERTPGSIAATDRVS